MAYKIFPVFIPHLGCPHQCVFCNQYRISGRVNLPKITDIVQGIKKNIEPVGEKTEIAFYGGSFTAIPIEIQKQYLEMSLKLKKKGYISRIRVSTRPDAINSCKLDLLKEYQVEIVELGVQSMDDDVLKAAQRGHTVQDVEVAIQALKEAGFKVGVQIMPGLPQDTKEICLLGIKKMLAYKPDFMRVYPTLVISETPLAEKWENGDFLPLNLREAVGLCAQIQILANLAQVKIIRMGLNPTKDLVLGESVLAGPFHPGFGNMVAAEVMYKKMSVMISNFEKIGIAKEAVFKASSRKISLLAGYKRQNFYQLAKKWKLKKVSCALNPDLRDDQLELAIDQERHILADHFFWQEEYNRINQELNR